MIFAFRSKISVLKNLPREHAQPEDIHDLLHKLLEDLKIISEELAEFINSLSWNRPTFYDVDDDEYTIIYRSSKAITPDLSIKEPDNSLSMGDEHLSTIPETESDEVIKSSVENLVPIPSKFKGISDDTCDVPFCDNSPPLDALKDHVEIFPDSNEDYTSSDDDYGEDIDYVEASPPDSELVSLDEVNDVYQENEEIDLEDILQIQDVILREKLLNINRLIANIESLNNNSTPDCVLKSPSPFPIPVADSGSFFENSDTSFSYSDNFYPNSSLLAIIRKRRVVAVPLLMLITLFPSNASYILRLSPIRIAIIFPSLMLSELFFLISLIRWNLLYFSPPEVKTPFLTLASPLRAGGISSGWNFHLL
ncbi:hypothetical protein Tco_0936678 [Tanacetum coccineum]|uniref:Uncharacterized protein n=1 Tax=Tanacetum coccineum TaxID=301880 RepID=A0ABQ5DE07_9ASTR